MAQAESRVPVMPTPAGRARNDVYTVLLIVAASFLLAATIYLGYVCYDYYGAIVPPSGG